MRMQKIGLMVVIALIGINSNAQHTVASGGDYVRQLFEKGRTEAASKVEALSSCSFDGSASPEAKLWILKNKSLLKNDIEKSSHLWVVDAQPTCAFTMHAPQSSIYLSYRTCDTKSADVKTSMFTLIHESAHHLGIADEKQADLIASMIMSATVVENCPDALSVFDSMICTGAVALAPDIGKLFVPGEASAVAGQYGIHVRSRLCSNLSGCGEWKPNQLTQGSKYNYTNTTFSPLAALGANLRTVFYAQAEAPYYKTDFCQSPYFECNSEFHEGSSQVNIAIKGAAATYDNTLLIKNLLKGRPYPAFTDKTQDQFGNIATYALRNFQVTGKTARHCSWYQKRTVDTLTEGFTQENEFVLYGTH